MFPMHPPMEVVCTAEAVYYEAGGASKSTKELVAKLVWNRAKDIHKSACYVIGMKGQFPWYKHKGIKKHIKVWSESLTVARTMQYKPSPVRYMVNSYAHHPAKNIHVITKLDGVIFYNRYNDPLWKGEYTYKQPTYRKMRRTLYVCR